jgi:hypothetical protein
MLHSSEKLSMKNKGQELKIIKGRVITVMHCIYPE